MKCTDRRCLAVMVLVAAAWLLLLAGCTSNTATGAAPPPASQVPPAPVPPSAPIFTSMPTTPAAPPPPPRVPSTAPGESFSSADRGGPPPVVVSTASSGTPQGAAVAWLTALRTASFRDSPSAWVERITPYVTPALAASYRQIAAKGTGGGAEWTAFVHDRCVSVVINAAGVIPAEAPATPAAAHVQVSATLTTVCHTGTRASEFIAATVLATKQHNRWAVTRREF